MTVRQPISGELSMVKNRAEEGWTVPALLQKRAELEPESEALWREALAHPVGRP